MVKSAPHVVEAVAQSSCEVWDPRGRMNCPIDVLRTTVVHSALEGVSAEVVKIPDRLLEGIAVCARPRKLGRYTFCGGMWGPPQLLGRVVLVAFVSKVLVPPTIRPHVTVLPSRGATEGLDFLSNRCRVPNRMFPHTQSWCI